ncbi:MAG: hypothetical protein IBX56_02420 [Methylomicrobium sp.]|nr:hypothetical protein [Methylomicrobium sp.]
MKQLRQLLEGGLVARLTGVGGKESRRQAYMDVFAASCQASHRTAAIPSLRNFAVFRMRGMPVEERRKPIHGGLTAAPCRRHPRQAHPAPFFILKLGIADRTAAKPTTYRSYFVHVP